MNKSQLIEEVATDLGIPKAAAARAIKSMIKSIQNGIDLDSAVTISGFGTFIKKDRPARTGRNPATGEPMDIKASKTVNFKPSQTLKDSMS